MCIRDRETSLCAGPGTGRTSRHHRARRPLPLGHVAVPVRGALGFRPAQGFAAVGAHGAARRARVGQVREVPRETRPVGLRDGRGQVPCCSGSCRACFRIARADPVARGRRCCPKTVRPRGGGPLPEALRQARGAAAAAVLVRLLSKTSGAAAAPLDGAPPSSVESSPGAGAAAPLRRAALSCSGAARGEELGFFFGLVSTFVSPRPLPRAPQWKKQRLKASGSKTLEKELSALKGRKLASLALLHYRTSHST